MTIIECLKKEIGVRVASGSRWLVWNETCEMWIVYEHKYRGRGGHEICAVSDDLEEEAVKYLMGEETEWKNKSQ